MVDRKYTIVNLNIKQISIFSSLLLPGQAKGKMLQSIKFITRP